MQFVDVIEDYIKTKASSEDIESISRAIEERKGPYLDVNVVKNRLIHYCKDNYNQNKLAMVKYIKDITGWGLMDSKNFFEQAVWPAIPEDKKVDL